jgi:adenosylmethionine-8-amino-7-oxononanoate aminotransferase
VSRERAYHGVNMGGTALSGMVKNREAFGAVMPGVLHLRHTLLPENRMTRGMGANGVELADDLLRFVQLVGEKRIAAVFVEPIAGSTGVLVPPRRLSRADSRDLRSLRHPAGVRRGDLRLRPHRRAVRGHTRSASRRI